MERIDGDDEEVHRMHDVDDAGASDDMDASPSYQAVATRCTRTPAVGQKRTRTEQRLDASISPTMRNVQETPPCARAYDGVDVVLADHASPDANSHLSATGALEFAQPSEKG